MNRVELEYLFRDGPCTPGQALPDYDSLDFDRDGEHIYGQIMWPGAGFDRPRPCVILLHGFPGSARNDDIAHALCRAGCVVFTPHMRGAWGSQGKYLVSRCVADAAALAAWTRSESFTRTYNTDPDAVYLVGHSMGACIALNGARTLSWLRGLVMMTPFDPARLLAANPVRLRELLQQGSILHSDGPDAIFEDIAVHKDALVFESAVQALKERNILLLTAEFDSSAPPEDMAVPFWKSLERYHSSAIRRYRSYPVEHGLLGCRTNITTEIARFIADTLDEGDAVRKLGN